MKHKIIFPIVLFTVCITIIGCQKKESNSIEITDFDSDQKVTVISEEVIDDVGCGEDIKMPEDDGIPEEYLENSDNENHLEEGVSYNPSKKGNVFVTLKVKPDFQYSVRCVIMNLDTSELIEVPIYPTNDFQAKKELSVGNYRIAEISVPNDYTSEFSFEIGQEFSITEGSTTEIISEQDEPLID